MIDGNTQLVGLIGWPTDHSLSPAIHNTAFAALGLNWCYIPMPTRPEQVAEAVRGLAALGFCGANVTVPHKQVVLPMLDSVTPAASKLGAVNTIAIAKGADGRPLIRGYNTDRQGFLAALQESRFILGPGSSAVVVGAGGAARAVVHGLLYAQMEKIVVLNRDVERAQALILDLRNHSDEAARLHALPLTAERLVSAVRTASLLVNATTVGMWPHMERSIWPDNMPIPAHLIVFDLVYNPPQTRLLEQARESGAHGVAGLEMLVQQGALAFEIWTGRLAPVEVMRTACKEALQRGSSP